MAARKKTKGTYGGWRPGSGRKPVVTDARKFSLTLAQATLDGLGKLADDEGLPLAVYVRRTLAQHVARRQRTRRSR